jgi:hypothetical protein
MNGKILCFCILMILFSIVSCDSSKTNQNPDDSTNIQQRIFYVDSINGNDSNSGLAESLAWQTIAKVNSFDLQPGDTVMFRKGLTYFGGLAITHSGTNNAPITFDAYGSGDLPVLSGAEEVTDWVDLGSSIYSKTNTYTPGLTGAGIVLEDGTPLKFRTWNTDPATSLGTDTGVFTYDPQDLNSSVIYIRCSDSGDPGSRITAGYYLSGFHTVNQSYLTFNNLVFEHFSLHGGSFKHCNNITIRNCTAKEIGGAALSASPVILAGNGFEFTLNSRNCSIYDSRAIDIFDSGFSPQVFESDTHLSDIRFENCTAERCGFAGIEISVLNYSGSGNESIENVDVVNCNVSQCGTGWSGIRMGTEGYGIRIKADDETGAISGVNIEGTIVRDCENSGIYIGGESGTVYITRSKVFDNLGSGINCAGISDINSIKLKVTASIIYNQNNGILYDVIDGNGFEIINNTFCDNSIAVAVYNCGGTGVLKNNIFYSSNTGHTHLYAANGISGGVSDYNCYYEHGGNIIGWMTNAYTTVSDFNSATALDGNSLSSDPVFVSASDKHLQASSLCKDSGTPAGVSVDYDENAYNIASPSRGAYQ